MLAELSTAAADTWTAEVQQLKAELHEARSRNIFLADLVDTQQRSDGVQLCRYLYSGHCLEFTFYLSLISLEVFCCQREIISFKIF